MLIFSIFHILVAAQPPNSDLRVLLHACESKTQRVLFAMLMVQESLLNRLREVNQSSFENNRCGKGSKTESCQYDGMEVLEQA